MPPEAGNNFKWSRNTPFSGTLSCSRQAVHNTVFKAVVSQHRISGKDKVYVEREFALQKQTPKWKGMHNAITQSTFKNVPICAFCTMAVMIDLQYCRILPMQRFFSTLSFLSSFTYGYWLNIFLRSKKITATVSSLSIILIHSSRPITNFQHLSSTWYACWKAVLVIWYMVDHIFWELLIKMVSNVWIQAKVR